MSYALCRWRALATRAAAQRPLQAAHDNRGLLLASPAAGGSSLATALARGLRCSAARASVMPAWQLQSYGGLDALRYNANTPFPIIVYPNEVVVRVHASSLNPIDAAMSRGYGARVLNTMRDPLRMNPRDSELPLVLGRDCSGVIMECGVSVQHFRPGDEVWLALPPWKQGTFAEFVVASANEVAHRPLRLSHEEAASMPYVALTAWSALVTTGGLNNKTARGKRVLILGGSGGVGTFAVQLLKAWAAHVTVTCSEDARPLLAGLGADHTLDYRHRDLPERARALSPFDLVLDGVGGSLEQWALRCLRPWTSAKYVTLVTPLLLNADRFGLGDGMVKSGLTLGRRVLSSFYSGVHYRWGFFTPNGPALDDITELVNSKKIRPVVEKVLPFQDVLKGLHAMERGHARGKTVVTVSSAAR
ncbi:NAD(P)H oxidoreductase RTN4IP1, mitochondrial [Lampetra fluviatilis]